jgi:hypothetical protein
MLNMPTPETMNKPAPNQNLFTVAHASQARRAKAWLDERVARAKAEGGFTEVGVELTPVLAEILLGRNPDNRTVSATNVEDIITDIKNGAWEQNGESIKIAEDGTMNDGQHRCIGVVGSGRSIKTDFRFGVTRESRMTLDQGRNRRTGDYLAMEGVPNGNHVAAVAAMVFVYERFGRLTRSAAKWPTKAQIRETYHANPTIPASISWIERKGSILAGGLSTLAFCHFIFSKKNPDAATAFVRSLLKGTELQANDPIYVCREQLRSRERLTTEEKVELIFHAWNAHRKGRHVKMLKVLGRGLPPVER